MVMYAPHKLFVKRVTITKDELNRTVGEETEWLPLGGCRCDDNTTIELKDDNGKVYVPKYHIVADKQDVKAGDYVRVYENDTLRGEGLVKSVIKTNYLGYMSLYV